MPLNLPCEVCKRKESVMEACGRADGIAVTILNHAVEIEQYREHYSDPELAAVGPDNPSKEFLDSIPGQVEALNGTLEQLAIDLLQVEQITCSSSLPTCMKPELIEIAAQAAHSALINVIVTSPAE